jgi:hypothetical protein
MPGHARAGPPVTGSRGEALWGLVAARAAGRGARVSVADVCAVAVSCAGVSGAWVTAVSDQGPDFVMGVTGPVSEQLAELQLTLGEGPCYEVLGSAAPVLGADLADGHGGRRWPAFTPAAAQLGAEAVFAFPLTIGAIRAGTMGLYRSSAGPLDRGQLGDSLLLADAATVLLLDGAGHDGAGLDGQAPGLAAHRAEIDQATGMLTVQLGVTAAEAFARLRAYAYVQDRRLADVAGDVVARRLRLRPEPDPDPAPGGAG